MVDDSLIFVNFDSNMGVGLSGNSSWFNELALGILIHVIAALSSRNIIRMDWHVGDSAAV